MTTRTPNEILSVLGFMEEEAVQLSILGAGVKKKHRGLISEKIHGMLVQINQLRWVMFMPDFNLSDAVIKRVGEPNPV